MYYVDTSDIRNVFLKELLLEKGKQVEEFSFEKHIKPNSVCVFSPAKKFTEETANNLPSNITLYAGNLTNEVIKVLENKNITYKNLMQDETFTIKNANLTCEGVLALIITGSNKSIYENNVLILGGGRIGKGMAIMLGKLGVKCSMVSFNKVKFPEYYLYSNKNYFGYSFAGDLSKFDVIVNTIPAEIIKEDVINKIAPDTLFIETASTPCLNPENATHFNYVKAPGLPKKYSAKTAGKLMYENIMEENVYD